MPEQSVGVRSSVVAQRSSGGDVGLLRRRAPGTAASGLSFVLLSGLVGASVVAYANRSGDDNLVHGSRDWTQQAPMGTARVNQFTKVASGNRYVPRTALGKRLLALREEAIREGAALVPVREIIADIAAFRS